ncbi:pyruvate ferredoxin oxidoreductase [Magnetospira sp. QH-2]|uniref:pyruvate ferredoxin oxidoreductase n=1 Tax=Magnetospira sp. (strain QH-2) TaxID=1288970 RepID=UPI0003E813A3|nr:pyruvate ferredoxin oxidoreductase [Magnetospira sp. QH-2]CCQ73649.1 Pyruvate synthase subunit porA [Magnetospira sp. QH-2]
MRQALEGSQAIAKAVALCRPGVVAAYPITPQTHIVENISKLVADGDMKTQLVSVESEFSAASVALGAAAAGSRAYTASSSQGIMLMAEVLFNIAGLRIPMVLTCANRAVGAPLNIWNDQSDSMAVRDSGWIQLYCADNQEAVDTMIQAYRITEKTELPVMVCMDGFILTHTLEVIDIPDSAKVDKYLPEYKFKRVLDPSDPISVGTLVSPEFFSEVRHSHHAAMQKALPEIVSADKAFGRAFKRSYGGLLSEHGDENATVAILTLGSVSGTLRAGMERYPPRRKTKIINMRCFRPFPEDAIREACAGIKDLIVMERAFSAGMGGIVGTEIRAALSSMKNPPKVHNVAVGLGGRDIPIEMFPRLMEALKEDSISEFSVFDVELDKLPKEDR